MTSMLTRGWQFALHAGQPLYSASTADCSSTPASSVSCMHIQLVGGYNFQHQFKHCRRSSIVKPRRYRQPPILTLLCTVPIHSGVLAPGHTEASDSASMLFCDSSKMSTFVFSSFRRILSRVLKPLPSLVRLTVRALLACGSGLPLSNRGSRSTFTSQR
jgi:hypothetical protein